MQTTEHIGHHWQAAVWNGTAGRAWVDTQQLLDRIFQPFENVLVESAEAQTATSVLDIGCGAGATTLAMARNLGASARCVGIDISEPMIAAARTRARSEGLPATFLLADAQHYDFEAASFDRVISRFGVMFFRDPAAAFANMRRAAAAGAQLDMLAWRSPEENPFMTAAERAAAPLLPHLPARQPNEPGQFGFADPRRVRRILEAGGWADIEVMPLDAECTLSASELTRYVTRLGPVGSAFAELDEPARTRVLAAVLPAFDTYVRGAEVRFSAACWRIRSVAR